MPTQKPLPNRQALLVVVGFDFPTEIHYIIKLFSLQEQNIVFTHLVNDTNWNLTQLKSLISFLTHLNHIIY